MFGNCGSLTGPGRGRAPLSVGAFWLSARTAPGPPLNDCGLNTWHRVRSTPATMLVRAAIGGPPGVKGPHWEVTQVKAVA